MCLILSGPRHIISKELDLIQIRSLFINSKKQLFQIKIATYGVSSTFPLSPPRFPSPLSLFSTSQLRGWSFRLLLQNQINVRILLPVFNLPIALLNSRIQPIEVCIVFMLCPMLVIPRPRPRPCLFLNLVTIASRLVTWLLSLFPFWVLDAYSRSLTYLKGS